MSALAGRFGEAEQSANLIHQMCAAVWADNEPMILRLGPSASLGVRSVVCGVQSASMTFEEAEAGVVVADARLDNRLELAERLAIDAVERRSMGDPELILRAYERWGERCPEHLLGDFAFAIWDDREQRLFLARDHFGARPLQYFAGAGLFAFASDARSILALDEVPKIVNRTRVFDYLIGDWAESADAVSTFYEGIYRLPPAHSMTVDQSGMRQRRYWQLEEPELLRLSSSAAYEDVLRAVLGEAVRCRLHPAGRSAVSLSGGIDSGALAVLGRADGLAVAYSAVSDEFDNAETPLIRASASQLDLRLREVTAADIESVCGSYRTTVAQLESPFDASMTLPRTVFGLAAREGHPQVMTGTLADEVLGLHQSEVLLMLLGERRFGAATRQAFGSGNLLAMRGRTWQARLLTAALLDTMGVGGALAGGRSRRWKRSLRTTAHDLGLRMTQDEVETLIERLEVHRMADFRSSTPGRARTERFGTNYGAAALERYHRTATSVGAETSTPFMDKRVVELALSLPANQLVDDAWTKVTLRRAMSAALPAETAWSTAKEHLGWTFNRAWKADQVDAFFADLSKEHPLRSVVETRVLGQLAKASGRADSAAELMADLGHWWEAQ